MEKKKSYNWAILGCGKIARKFSNDLKHLDQAVLYAAASRNIDRAKQFASELGFQKPYGSYEEMVNDPEVDVVYIASPHSHHKEHTLLCLEHHKAVLCEKAFAINAKEVKTMIAASKKHSTFLMEAFWTIWQPKFKKVLELSNKPELGRLQFVKSDFMFKADFDPDKRLYNIELGAGSLLDIGIYPIFRALTLLGKPDQIKVMANVRETGVEDSISMLFGYDNGAMALLSSSFEATCSNHTELCFEHGYIRYERDPEHPIYFQMKNEEVQEIWFEPSKGLGYELEAEHVMECLDKGWIESDTLTLSKSLDLMEIMDQVRAEAGIRFPGHDD